MSSKLTGNSNTNVTDINPPYGILSLYLRYNLNDEVIIVLRRLPEIPKPGPQR